MEKNTGNWCTYILRCRNGAYYIGITNDLDRRIKSHAAGKGSKYVRTWSPFELVKTVSCVDESEARRLEARLKRLSRAEKILQLGLEAGTSERVIG